MSRCPTHGPVEAPEGTTTPPAFCVCNMRLIEDAPKPAKKTKKTKAPEVPEPVSEVVETEPDAPESE